MSIGAALEIFTPDHAAIVLTWVRSPDELDAWASRTDHPLTASVFDDWHADPEVYPLVLAAAGRVHAYGEIWEDRERGEVELARIIVAPEFRGRGVGREFVSMLADEAVRRGFRDVWLRVLPSNAPALACYRSAGFRRAGADDEERFNRRQPRPYAWLRLQSVS